MQAIHVRRYQNNLLRTPGDPGAPRMGIEWAGWVEPEDRSWVLFIPVDGQPCLFQRVQCTKDDGTTEHSYAPESTEASPPT